MRKSKGVNKVVYDDFNSAEFKEEQESRNDNLNRCNNKQITYNQKRVNQTKVNTKTNRKIRNQTCMLTKKNFNNPENQLPKDSISKIEDECIIHTECPEYNQSDINDHDTELLKCNVRTKKNIISKISLDKQSKLIKIYSIVCLKDTINKNRYEEYDIDMVCQKLVIDRSYHFRIQPNTNYIFFGSINHYVHPFIRFITLLRSFLDIYYSIKIDINDVKFTTNFGNYGSYHYSVPKLYCSCEKLREIHINLIKMNSELMYDDEKGHLIQCIECAVYEGDWFRAPNQSKECNDKVKHEIINGSIRDFVVEFVPKDSLCIENYEFTPHSVNDVSKLNKKTERTSENNKKQTILRSSTIIQTTTSKSEQYQKKLLILNLIDNCFHLDRFDDRNDQDIVGNAIMNELQTEGFGVFNYFSSKGKSYEGKAKTKEKYFEFEINRVHNINAIIEMADEDNCLKCIEIMDKYNTELMRDQKKEPIYRNDYNPEFLNMLRGEADVSDLFYQEYKNCMMVDSDKNNVYIYNEKTALWELKGNRYYLQVMKEFFEKIIHDENKKIMESSNELKDRVNNLAKLGKIKNITQKASFKKGVWDQAHSSFQNFNFLTSLNNSKYYLPIANRQVVDLRTGLCEERKAKHYFTFECPAHILDGETPHINSLFSTMMNGDIEAIQYIQKCLGYCLTSETTSKCMFVFLGNSSKYVVCELLKSILNGLHISVSKKILVKDLNRLRPSGLSPELIPLINARTCVLVEIDENDELNINQIQALFGYDTITVQDRYQKKFNFRPICKPIMLTNCTLQLSTQDKVNIDMIKYIPLCSRFTNNSNDLSHSLVNDHKFIEKLRTEYLSEVLTWFVKGSIAWYACDQKLVPPLSVRTSALEYFNEFDSIGNFILDMCVFIEGVRINRVILFKKYEAWCFKNNQPAKNALKFYAELLLNGNVKCVKVRGYNYLKNITLKDVENKTIDEKKFKFIDNNNDNDDDDGDDDGDDNNINSE